MTDTYDQPTKAPNTKMTAVAIGGSVASLLMGGMAIFFPEQYKLVPPGFEGGLATLVGFVLGYAIKERI